MCIFCCCVKSTKQSPQESHLLDTENEIDYYIAQRDFNPTDENDLALKKGDKIELFDVNDIDSSWSKARNLKTGKIGMVPLNFLAQNLQTQLWFFNDINANASEALLLWEGNENGTFLVRPNFNQQPPGFKGLPYILSVRTENDYGVPIVKHYKIHFKEQKYFISPGLESACLIKLIKYYILVDSMKCGLCANITKPCAKIDPIEKDLNAEERKNFEISMDEIRILQQLGKGYFSTVHKALWKKKEIALKETNDKISPAEISKEIKISKQLRHKNIVSLYGYAVKGEKTYLIMEYVPYGDLLNYVNSNDLNLVQLVYVATQIAEAMTYLENKKIVHRDLAARNVLVKERLTVKLADFGLSKFLFEDEVYLSLNGLVAVPWLAPECFVHKFSSKSDIWAFAILVMEIFTKDKPYPQVKKRNIENFAKVIKRGDKMEQPTNMPNDIYQRIYKCWNLSPEKRPTFLEMFNFFDSYSIIRECN